MKRSLKIGEMLDNRIEAMTDRLAKTLPDIEFEPEVSDAKIKQAILGMKPEGWQKLYGEFGQEAVVSFINDFGQRKRW